MEQEKGPPYNLAEFVNVWMQSLTSARLYTVGPEASPKRKWDTPDSFPNGSADRSAPDRAWDGDIIFNPPTLGPQRQVYSQPARQLSSGFHQLLPIVVQAGLMRPQELLAIENPEVHLHPSLQIDACEFLIRQAEGHKLVVVETQSDLLVRRALRAVAQERVRQELIRLHFVDVDKSEQGFQYSTITPLVVNDQGKVNNWPPGFLDADVEEAIQALRYTSHHESESDVKD
jgi:hypothetical protein